MNSSRFAERVDDDEQPRQAAKADREHLQELAQQVAIEICIDAEKPSLVVNAYLSITH